MGDTWLEQAHAQGLIEAFLFKIFVSNFMTDNVK